MSLKGDQSFDLLQEIVQTGKIIGSDRLKKAVIDARQNGDAENNNKLIEKFILSKVTHDFNISASKLLTGKSKGRRTDALMILYCITKSHLKYSLTEQGALYKKNHTGISRYITEFNMFKGDTRHEQNLKAKYDKISTDVSDYIKKIQK